MATAIGVLVMTHQLPGEGRGPEYAGTDGPRPSPGNMSYRDACPGDGPKLDAMARAVWLETFGHSGSGEDIALYLAKAYGPDGDLIRHLSDPDHRFRIACAG